MTTRRSASAAFTADTAAAAGGEPPKKKCLLSAAFTADTAAAAGGEPPKKKQTSTFGRSVVDYVSKEELDEALLETTTSSKSDWILPISDPDAIPQNKDEELQRLLTLKSYMLLDTDESDDDTVVEFEKLTREARDIFGVPTSLISLIDLGRQFLFSNTGAYGGVRETTRQVAFCSHTILNKHGMLVVNDTKQDERFCNSELVNQGPKLRFYAGAPLITPEGHKLGTFCVEGPSPRPEGLSDEEKTKLKEYAAKTVEMMVERRKKLRDKLSGNNVSLELRKHAGVATSLGDILYVRNDYVTAMRLYQESVQTVMWVEQEEDEQEGEKKQESSNHPFPAERQEAMAQLLTLLSFDSIPEKQFEELLNKVRNLYDKPPPDTAATAQRVIDGLPGLFHGTKVTSKLAKNHNLLPGLFFNEVFKIDFGEHLLDLPNHTHHNLDFLPFTVPLDECSKATLFNMGQIHYHWGSQETALQFFHLAASVSHKISPLAFDPIDLGCVNNMAQIHLQLGQADEAMKMLTEALERGNRTLAAMYRLNEPEPVPEKVDDDDAKANDDENASEEEPDNGADEQEEDVDDEAANRDAARRTSRIRRKLARTIINIGHVHYFNCNYDAAMSSLHKAAHLLDNDTMTGRTLAAIHYNMSMTFHRQNKNSEALNHLDQFLEKAVEFNGPDHLQNADALYRKAQIMVDMGNFQDAMKPLEESLRIRKLHFTKEPHGAIAEALCLGGKILLAKGETDAAVTQLSESTDIQRQLLNNSGGGEELTFELAQTLLEMGRAYHVKGDLGKSLEIYLEVYEWTKKFFGPRHAFVARVSGIIGDLYAESGNMEESKPYKEEAASILQQSAVGVQ